MHASRSRIPWHAWFRRQLLFGSIDWEGAMSNSMKLFGFSVVFGLLGAQMPGIALAA